ncbi:hypothetical protein ACIQFZ_40440 [Streptomyces sp. NPDC093064]|uniref:hypothetical protein n=1 Tax=Streptomyces sp. NPDC093064 TaxID=3366020 RepID=UPI00381F1BC1
MMNAGRVRFDGTVAEFVGTATGRVWLADAALPGAEHSWRTGSGRVRSIGGRPGEGAEPAEPSVEDAYLLMLGTNARPTEEVAA